MHCAVLLSQYVVSQVTVLTIDIDTDINTDTVYTDTEAVCKLYFVNHMSHISI